MPEALDDRAADNWCPLFAIAERAGGDWPAFAREAALKLSSARDDTSTSVMLLHDIRDFFERRKTKRLASEEICNELGRAQPGRR